MVDYGMDDQVCILGRDFSRHHMQTGSGANTNSSPMNSGDKAVGADHSPSLYLVLSIRIHGALPQIFNLFLCLDAQRTGTVFRNVHMVSNG